MDISEMWENALGRRMTQIKDGICKNCGGSVMFKWKYGSPDIACMNCGEDMDYMDFALAPNSL